jgi:hypothetical protein
MMSRRMLIFLIVMASLVAGGKPALALPEAIVEQPIAMQAWPQRQKVSRTLSRIGVLQRMTAKTPVADAPRVSRSANIALAIAPLDPRYCALPPPIVG